MTINENMKTIAFTIAALTAVSALAIPGLASAQNCNDRTRDNQTNGAILGAVAGAAVGNGVSAHHDRGAGTLLGAVLGGVVGANVGRDSTKCQNQAYETSYVRRDYGYDNGRYYQPQPRTVYSERVIVEQQPAYDRDYREHRYIETRSYTNDDHGYSDQSWHRHHEDDGDRGW